MIIDSSKNNYSIQEICAITGVKSYVLRFWESEFDIISPSINDEGEKVYSRFDLSAIVTIKILLFDEKYSIERARSEVDKRIKDANNLSPVEEKIEVVEEMIPSAVPAVPAVPVEISNNNNDIIMTDKEIQKLVLAKAKLTSLIGLADSIL